MFVYTTISSENDAVHLTGHTVPDKKKGGYRYKRCSITFWELQDESYRTEESRIIYILDNEKYMLRDLLPQLEKFCDIEKFEEFELHEHINEALGASLIDPYELRDMLRKAIEIGILFDDSQDPFKTINNFFD